LSGLLTLLLLVRALTLVLFVCHVFTTSNSLVAGS
jgi:hypothetical protein